MLFYGFLDVDTVSIVRLLNEKHPYYHEVIETKGGIYYSKDKRARDYIKIGFGLPNRSGIF